MNYIEVCTDGVITSFDKSYESKIILPSTCSDSSEIIEIGKNAGERGKMSSIDMSQTKITIINSCESFK